MKGQLGASMRYRNMKQSDFIEQAKGYVKGMQTAIKIINKIDREHPEYKMPMEMWCRLRAEVGKAEDFLAERGKM